MKKSPRFSVDLRIAFTTLIGVVILSIGIALINSPALAKSTQNGSSSTQAPALPDTTINSDITSNTTWDLTGSPYVVTTDVNILPGVTLTIDPGVEVRFQQYVALTAQGTLTAIGTPTQPITFTGTTKTPGWWDSVSITGSDSAHPNNDTALSYVTLQYGGYSQANLYLQYAHVPVDHARIDYSGGDGVYGDTGGIADLSNTSFTGNNGYAAEYYDGSVDPVLSNLSATGNSPDGVAIDGGTMTGNNNWEASGLPYFITGDETVGPTAALTISPGAEIRFDEYQSLIAQGTLTAIGTPTQPITFTGTTKTPGWWDSVSITGSDSAHPNNDSALSYVTLQYGGYSQANLYLQYAHVPVDHARIDYSGGDGVYGDTGGIADLSNTSFTGNNGYAAEYYDGSVDPVLSNLSATGNSPDGVAIDGGTMTGNNTWEASGLPYFITGQEDLSAGGSLTIQPGVEVRFDEYQGLNAHGILTAIGTPTQPITFTGATKTPGWWDSVSITGSDSTHPNNSSALSYVTLQYGGYSQANLYLQYAHVPVDHARIDYSGGDGVYGDTGGIADLSNTSFTGNNGYAAEYYDGSVDPVLSNLSASGNSPDGVAIDGGTMTGNNTWEASGLPYFITGQEDLSAGGSLTIQPGVEVRFDEYQGLNAHGILTAIGTPTQPITFTGATKTPGWWDSVSITGSPGNPNVGSSLQYVTIEYGGYSTAEINVENGKLNVSDSQILYSGSDGFYAGTGGAGSTIHNSQIVNNADFAVENYDSAYTLQADNNWWGSPNGPQLTNGCNPSGSGGRISGNVAFQPYLTSGSQQSAGLAGGQSRLVSMTPLRWFVPADGVSRAWVKITVQDGNGQPLPGRVVYLNSTLGDVTDGGITDVQGQTMAYITSNTPGDARLTPSLSYQNNCETSRGATATITFTPPSSADKILPDSEAPYMNNDIQVEPLPVVQGMTTTLSATFTNPNSFPVKLTATFGIAQEGIGLTFGPLGERQITIPANGRGTAQLTWKPLISGHYCVQVLYAAQAASSLQPASVTSSGYSQRNLDIAPFHLNTFHQNNTLRQAQRATNAISNAQTAIDLATSPANPVGFFIPNQLFSKILDFNFSTWGKASDALAGDPPRQDYTTLATLEHFTFTPVQAGSGVSPARAQAANELMSAALDLTSKLRAAEISLDRYSGATEADDLEWASLQASAYLYYRSLSGSAMIVAANKLDAMIAEMQSEAIPDRVFTADMIRAYQDRLRTQGFNADELAAAQAINLTSAEIEEIRQTRINEDPNLVAGSVTALVEAMSNALRQTGNALLATSPVTSAAPAQGLMPASGEPNQLIRANTQTYTIPVANPQNQSATVELKVRPLDLPDDWGVSITPITSTLNAGEQVTATLVIAPSSTAVQGSHPRVAVEAYIQNQLIGGVVQDILVPDIQPFDGKVRLYLPAILK